MWGGAGSKGMRWEGHFGEDLSGKSVQVSRSPLMSLVVALSGTCSHPLCCGWTRDNNQHRCLKPLWGVGGAEVSGPGSLLRSHIKAGQRRQIPPTPGALAAEE